ncbi:M23 family metallopeptidase [Ralstonia insidiosa]|nr:M23 family metallopeptidase [Ralstonia insidiosa]
MCAHEIDEKRIIRHLPSHSQQPGRKSQRRIGPVLYTHQECIGTFDPDAEFGANSCAVRHDPIFLFLDSQASDDVMQFDLLSCLAREQGRSASNVVPTRRVRRSLCACLALLYGSMTAVIPAPALGVTPAPDAPAVSNVAFMPPAGNLVDARFSNVPHAPWGASSVPSPTADPQSGTRAGEIASTFRKALARADLPGDLLQQITRLLRGKVDMSARGQEGDYFRVAYEPVADTCCEQAIRLTAIEVQFRGKRHAGVWFATNARPQGDYYRFDGTLMAGLRFTWPVQATRISSDFGERTHPVTGVHHGHSGVDLAAPTGRAVRASEAGVVAHIGNERRGYGKYVVIRHPEGLTSYYAHLSKIDPKLRVGMHIERAQRVGAVGRTGTATGPHLHFEVRRDDRPVDPLALIRKASVQALQGDQLVAFQRVAALAMLRLAGAGPASVVAT